MHVLLRGHSKHASADVARLSHFTDLWWPCEVPKEEWELVDVGLRVAPLCLSWSALTVLSAVLRSGSDQGRGAVRTVGVQVKG